MYVVLFSFDTFIGEYEGSSVLFRNRIVELDKQFTEAGRQLSTLQHFSTLEQCPTMYRAEQLVTCIEELAFERMGEKKLRNRRIYCSNSNN